jgi:hypothetical protein
MAVMPINGIVSKRIRELQTYVMGLQTATWFI